MSTPRIAVCQMDSQDDKEENLEMALKLLDEAGDSNADLAALPEMFTYMGDEEKYYQNSEEIPGEVTKRLSKIAKEHSMYIHGGSMFETSTEGKKVYNTSTFFDRDGNLQNSYRKIHLFDIEIEGEVVTQESAQVKPGKSPKTVDTDFAPIGLSICYDLRFPELFSTLSAQGAEIIILPAAFTLHTGKDHWETLLRARAIENQAYVVAPAQIGNKPKSATSYGRSVIIDPWGTVIRKAGDTESVVTADLDLEYLETIRRELPSLEHKRHDLYTV